MALGEKRKTTKNVQRITQVSWTDGVSLDQYYWLEHSFQYARNINCDDEMHWLKLSQKALRYDDTNSAKLGKCQLVSVWDNGIIALPVWSEASQIRIFDDGITWHEFENGWAVFWWARWWPNRCPWTVFQNHFWHWVRTNTVPPVAWMLATDWTWTNHTYIPHDHTDTTDDAISNPTSAYDNGWRMTWPITAILNYNNARLVVADGSDIWVYYPELDLTNPNSPYYYHNQNSPYYDPNYVIQNSDYWKTWWKKTMTFEAGVDIVWLTCTFEYLKVRARDEWRNTQVYYYQGNNNLRDTFVYNVVYLTGQRVTRVYSINSVDYFITSTDGSDGFVNLNKMVGTTPIQLLKQRAWLIDLDVNDKDPYFVWPVSLDAPYQSGRYYIADAYWIFSFAFNPQWYDPWYMKWWLNNNKRVYGACINKNYLYVSDDDWCWKIRIYDTWKPIIQDVPEWYQDVWVLISREFEWLEWWTMTKMLDSIRVNYEMNPLTRYNGTIDIYVSPNNLWKSTKLYPVPWTTYKLFKWTWLPASMEEYISPEYDWWYHVLHLWQENVESRTERMEVLNKLWPSWKPAFWFDWQTITYAIVFNRYTAPNNPTSDQTHAQCATPILRQIDINYHTKDKINNVYDINNEEQWGDR